MIGTTNNNVKRDRAGAIFIEGREQLVKTATSKTIGKKQIARNTAVEWWDEYEKEVKRARTETRKTDIKENYAGWEEYAKPRK